MQDNSGKPGLRLIRVEAFVEDKAKDCQDEGLRERSLLVLLAWPYRSGLRLRLNPA